MYFYQNDLHTYNEETIRRKYMWGIYYKDFKYMTNILISDLVVWKKRSSAHFTKAFR
jgi:hypothetical protein